MDHRKIWTCSALTHSMEIKQLKSSPTFRSSRTIRRLQPSLYALCKARCSLAKVSECQIGRWWGEPCVAFAPPSSFERSETLSRLDRALDGAWSRAFSWAFSSWIEGFLCMLWSSIKCIVDLNWQLSCPKTGARQCHPCKGIFSLAPSWSHVTR